MSIIYTSAPLPDGPSAQETLAALGVQAQEVARLTGELAAVKQERDALAAALDKFGQHQPYCYETKTATEKGFIAPPYRHCTCGFSQVIEHTSAILATVRAKARAEGLAAYLTDAREFSRTTFGEGNRTLGVTKHIEKEIAEVRAKPFDLTEWVDIIILACDGYWRHGGEPENLLRDMMAKLAKNKARKWPKPISEDGAVEHDRTHDDPLNPELGPEHREYWVRKVRTEAFHERESAYVKISQQLLEKYVNLFRAYAWTDEQTAIDLMAAEIATLRIEKAKERAEGMRKAAELCRIKWGSVGTVLAADLDRLADAEEAGKG